MTLALAPTPPATLAGHLTIKCLADARRLLETAFSVEELKAVRDMAELCRQFAQAAGVGADAVCDAAEVKIRAERRAGEVLSVMARNVGGQPEQAGYTGHGAPPVDRPPKLSELGISKRQSADWQAIATLPEPAFERYLGEAREQHSPIATATLVTIARKARQATAREARVEQLAERTNGHARPALPPTVRIETADARAMPLDRDSVHLTVTSPPYGLGIDYDGSADPEPADWRRFLYTALVEVFRVTVPSGRLALNVPLDTASGGFRPVYSTAVQMALSAGWSYRSTIVWIDDHLGKSTARGSVDSASAPYVYAGCEMIALFSKGDWARHPPALSDVDHQDWLQWTNGVWPLRGETRPYGNHPAPFTLEIPRRLIQLLSFPGDVVLDPFSGSGTTVLAAAQLNRQAIGFDRSKSYTAFASRRVAEWLESRR